MWWPSCRASDSGARGRGFDPHSGRRVVSLSKTHLPPKSTGNTQEAVAPSRHDRKIVYWDFKQKRNENYWWYIFLLFCLMCSMHHDTATNIYLFIICQCLKCHVNVHTIDSTSDKIQ